jgi:outer membrane protein TolC
MNLHTRSVLLFVLLLIPFGTLAGAAELQPEISAVAVASGNTATVLSLSAYLDQVHHSNLAIQSAEAANHALDLSVNEAKAYYSPQLTGELSHLDNRAQTATPLFQGDHTLDTAWNINLSKRWETGTLTALGYKSDWSEVDYPAGTLAAIPGFGTLLPSSSPFYTSGPTLTLTQPLWRDFMAGGAKATIDKTLAASRAAQALNNFAIAQVLFAAEQAYIQTALALATVAVQEASLQRNQRILEITRRHVAQNLTDVVDAYQSEAAVKQVTLALNQAREDLQNARRQFNTLRNRPDLAEVEALEPLTLPSGSPQRRGDRADVVAAAQNLASSQAAVSEIVNKYVPDVSVYASAGLTGRDPSYAQALSQSFSTSYPVTTVGVKVSANLDLPLIQDTVKGAQLVTQAGDVSLRQKRLDLDKDWDVLLRHWASVAERLETVAELEQLQKLKADREKIRYQNGRTTDFQVLRFEDDYAQASLLHMRLIAEARLAQAQARLYNGEEK